MSRRTFRAALAGATALTLALAPTAAIANDDAPDEPLEVRGSSNSVGQSVQIRTDADGNPNSSATDFRWSVTQIGAQGDPGADITVAVPEEGLLLHNLQKFGMIPQEDGKGLFDISLNDTGFGTARSVSLVPPEDFELPVELTTEFTLDGEPILAQDLVGKDGVVTAKYTVINKTRETLTVPDHERDRRRDREGGRGRRPDGRRGGHLLPDRFSALNTGAGLGGADGRGNTQVKWIALPFAPLSKDGTSTFGWAANVTNAVIPSMLVQVLPIYIPPGEGGAKDPANEAARQAAFEAVPPPDVSGDVNAIKGGRRRRHLRPGDADGRRRQPRSPDDRRGEGERLLHGVRHEHRDDLHPRGSEQPRRRHCASRGVAGDRRRCAGHNHADRGIRPHRADRPSRERAHPRERCAARRAEPDDHQARRQLRDHHEAGRLGARTSRRSPTTPGSSPPRSRPAASTRRARPRHRCPPRSATRRTS